MRNHEITTGRLRLRPLRPAEGDALHALWTAPRVRRFLWDDRVVPREQTDAILRQSVEWFDRRGYGLWSIRPAAGSTLLGFGGFWEFRDPPDLELILGLAPDHWGRGYATEAGLALIRHGFRALGFPEIRGSTDAPNRDSVRLMRRLGMEFQRREVVDGLDTVFHRAVRETWRDPDRGAAGGAE